MKKLVLTIAIVLGLGLTSFADPYGGGLFKRGANPDQNFYRNYENGLILEFPVHEAEGEQQEAPLGSGVAIMLGLGAAYLIGKRREE